MTLRSLVLGISRTAHITVAIENRVFLHFLGTSTIAIFYDYDYYTVDNEHNNTSR